MECKFCGKKLIELKRDWDTRSYHKTCYKKQRTIWYIDKQIKACRQVGLQTANNYRVLSDLPTLNISNSCIASSS